MILTKYLKSSVTQHMSEVESSQNSAMSWHSLVELVLTRLIIFNKRRSGEIARMTVQVYNEGTKWRDSVLEEFAAILTPFEKTVPAYAAGKDSSKVWFNGTTASHS